jgi:regulator of RNase E activity RraB
MSGEPTKVIFDPWGTYVAETEEGPLFISFDDGATREDLSASLPHCARVIVPIQNPHESGMPVSPESERLYQMEDQLCALLSEDGVECRLVGRLTHAGVRELVFQLADWDAFRPPVGYWMTQHPEYELDVSEHEGWEFFNEIIRPSLEDRLMMADRRVVDGLIEAGSDPQKPHVMDHAFRGPGDALRKLADALASRGYRPQDTLDFDSGLIVLVKEMTLDLGSIVEESIANHRLAAEHGAEYDGWGAAVVK